MNENDLLPCPCGAVAEFSGLNAADEPCPACTVCSFRTLSVIDWNTRSNCLVLPEIRSDNPYIHEPLAAAGYNECIEDTKALNSLKPSKVKETKMSWSHYGNDKDGRPIGYAIDAVCDHKDCSNEIDRGLDYVCGGMHGEDDIAAKALSQPWQEKVKA